MAASAIQLAVAAGIIVVSVASKHNIEKVKALGAKHVFDYNSPSVADDIINSLQDTDFVGICDCIGLEHAAKAWSPVYKKLGGRYGTVTPSPVGVPEGIEGGPGTFDHHTECAFLVAIKLINPSVCSDCW